MAHPATAPVTVGAAMVGLIDPAWAPVANTMLILVLAYIQAQEAAKSRAAAREAREAARAARDAKKAAGANRRGDAQKPDTGHRRRWTDTPEGETG